ncbi:MAG TPA: hypothetical protein VF328_08495, partial [Mycobacterium sp.]
MKQDETHLQIFDFGDPDGVPHSHTTVVDVATGYVSCVALEAGFTGDRIGHVSRILLHHVGHLSFELILRQCRLQLPVYRSAIHARHGDDRGQQGVGRARIDLA